MAGTLLFDLDGTLLHSDPLHYAVFKSILADRGYDLSQEEYDTKILGRANQLIFTERFPGEDWQVLADDKEDRFLELLGPKAPPTPGIVALLDRAEANGWNVAIVTNAPRKNATGMLSAIGLTDRFELVIAAGDAPHGKPHPAPYLMALEKLGVTADEALVFEDSAPGVGAGAAAGIFTVGMRSSLDDAALREAGASLTIADFTDPALEQALARLKR